MQNIALNVGPIHVADGGQGQQGLRSGRELDFIVSENRGRYAEKTSRGGKFCAPWNAVTVAATHNSPLTAGTGTPIVGIYNPIGSGFNLEIVKLSQHLISGTPAGPLIWNNIPLPQNITAASSTPISRLLNASPGSVAKLWVNTAVTGSSTGILLFAAGGFAAVAAGAGPSTLVVEYAGDLIVPPGSMLALCSYGTGTTHISSGDVEWDEVFVQ